MKESIFRSQHLAAALLFSACASSAWAGVVTPALTQVRESETRLPEVYEKCAKHEQVVRAEKARDKSKDGACEKVIKLLSDAAIAGSNACQASFHPTVRSVMEKSLTNTIKAQELHCSYADAVAAVPCENERCKGTVRDVLRVITNMTTKELDESMNEYSGLMQKLQAEAAKTGCDKLNLPETKALIVTLSKELDNARVTSVRFRVGNLPALPAIEQAMVPSRSIVSTDRMLGTPIEIGEATARLTDSTPSTPSPRSTASTGSAEGQPQATPQDQNPYAISDGKSQVGLNPNSRGNALKFEGETFPMGGAAQKSPEKLPAGVNVIGALETGGIGFVFQDPITGNCMIGVQTKDPKTGALKSYAYPVGGATAEACANNPTLLAKTLLEAKDSAEARGRPEQEAMDRAQAIFAVKEPASKSPSKSPSKTASTDPSLVARTEEKKPAAKATKVDSKKVTQGNPQIATVKEKSQTVSLKTSDQADRAEKPRSIQTLAKTPENLKEAIKRTEGANPKDRLATDEARTAVKLMGDNASSTQAKSSAPKTIQKPKNRSVAKTQKPSEKPRDFSIYSTTESGFGQVRYFAASKPPYGFFVGRVIEVNGRTQILIHRVENDAEKFKSLSQDQVKLKAAFNDQNSDQASFQKSLLLEQGADNNKIRDAFLLDKAFSGQ